ncbi:MAG: hypothetical protein LC104_01515 [Bacteroidales bacterium]|nr:hypothetical protein [Bacteroidales bacterium]
MTLTLNLNGFHINLQASDEEYLTIDVDCFTVILKREAEGIVVDVYPLHAVDEPVATTYAFHSDAGVQDESE